MDTTLFLHAAHQVRDTLDGLRLVSWLVIGLAVGAVVMSWGRLLSWLRAPDRDEGPRLVRWGSDEEGCYFEVAGSDGEEWSAEGADGGLSKLARADGGVLRCGPLASRPSWVVSSGGARLPL